MLYFEPKLQLYMGDSDFNDASQTHVGHIIPSYDFGFRKFGCLLTLIPLFPWR